MKTRILAFILAILGAACPLAALDYPGNLSIGERPDPYPFTTFTFTATGLRAASGAGELTDAGSAWNSLNWHRILGYATLCAGAAAMVTAAADPEGSHCPVAHAATALAAATTAQGYYQYYGVIGSDWKYTIHALLATIATAGFIHAVASADGDTHAAVGGASGITFAVAVAVAYF